MGQLEVHYERLHGHPSYGSAACQTRNDGSALIWIPQFSLPPGWNKSLTNVRFLVPVGYPIAKPDCFWTDADLRLASGGTPMNTQLNASYGGSEQLLWFSFHIGNWNANRDDLVTYANSIRSRFQTPK
jgi:hypothetical protein